MNGGVIDIAELGEWRPEIQRLPEVKPHAMYLDQFHFGGITCSRDALHDHVQICQLALATQLSRAADLAANEKQGNGGGS